MHPTRGQATLATIEALREASLLIRSHHENYDGSGYPDGLKGEDIPIGARIIALADYLDWSIQTAIENENPILFALLNVEKEIWEKFDPNMYHWLEKPAQVCYSGMAVKEDERLVVVVPNVLAPGMILGKDIWSGTRILLLRKGSQLDEHNIDTIRRIYQYDPPNVSFVQLERKLL